MRSLDTLGLPPKEPPPPPPVRKMPPRQDGQACRCCCRRNSRCQQQAPKQSVLQLRSMPLLVKPLAPPPHAQGSEAAAREATWSRKNQGH